MRIIYLFIGFVLGVYVTNNYDISMFSQLPALSPHSKHQAQSSNSGSAVVKSTATANTVTRAMCPSAEIVRKQVGQQGPWKANGLMWSFETLSWQPPEKIVFHQAFYYPATQAIRCDYTWPNPKDPTTLLSLQINLNPNASQNVKVAGSHWGQKGDLFMCGSASPETCAFDIINQ